MDKTERIPEPEFSSMTNEKLLDYVFTSGDTWYQEADREMHRRLVAGRNDLLVGRKNDAWGELLIKIVTRIVQSNPRYREIQSLPGHEIAELVSEFMLELVNRGSWTEYECEGKLVSYLVGRSSPLSAAFNIVKNPRRKQSDEPIKTFTAGDIAMMEAIAYGSVDSSGRRDVAFQPLHSEAEAMSDLSCGEDGEGAETEKGDTAKSNKARVESARAQLEVYGMLVEQKEKASSFQKMLEDRDLVKPAIQIFQYVAATDPAGARAYCLFAYGIDRISAKKLGDDRYCHELMACRGLQDKEIAERMGKSKDAVTKARSLFLKRLRICGDAFLKNEKLCAMSRAGLLK